MGGGSSPAPVQQNVNNTQIPDYLAPYASNMLNATQAQIFNPTTNPDGTVSYTSFKPYQPYSTDPTKYFADFSPLQKQAQSTVANLQTPSELNQASNLTGQAGQGALNTVGQAGMYGGMGAQAGRQGAELSNLYGGLGSQAGQQYAGQSSMYGGMGAMQGQQGANIGQQLGQMATNPNAVQSYMNPYIQASLNPQLQLLAQQTGIQSAGEQAAATRAGAFGGSRQALQNSLVQQAGNLAAQQAIGQGYNTAFNNAQQQMNAANQAALAGNAQALQGLGMGLQGAGQAGSQAMQGYGMGLQGAGQAANLGIQGAQAGLAGVGAQQAGYGQAGAAGANLANIGNQKLAAQEGIANLQNQFGGQQTQAQQNIINQAVQNYATAQQYPFMQLGVMNAMLRGLPTQQTSTSMYQAPPSTVSQLGGLGLAGLGGLGMYNAATRGSKRGGKVKAMAVGGAVPMNMMSDQQLQQVQQSPASSPMAKMYAQGLDQMHGYIHNNPEANKVMSQPLPSGGMPPPDQMSTAPQTRTGVAAIGTGDMTKMAEGGIIAFAAGGDKGKLLSDVDADEKMFRDYLTSNLAELQSGKGSVTEAYKPLVEEQKADIAQQRAMILPEFAFRTGIGMMSGAGDRTGGALGNFVSSLGTSALGAETGMQKSLADINAAKKLMQTGTLEAAKQDQARRDQAGIVAAQMLGNINAKKVGMAQAEAQKEMAAATRGAGIASANALKEAALTEKGQQAFAGLVEKYMASLGNNELKKYNYQANPLQLKADAYNYAYMDLAPTYRDKLGLPTPTEYYKNLGLTPPGAAPVTPTQTSPIINPPKVNPAMPTVPKAQFHFDPATGTLVPG